MDTFMQYVEFLEWQSDKKKRLEGGKKDYTEALKGLQSFQSFILG